VALQERKAKLKRLIEVTPLAKSEKEAKARAEKRENACTNMCTRRERKEFFDDSRGLEKL